MEDTRTRRPSRSCTESMSVSSGEDSMIEPVTNKSFIMQPLGSVSRSPDPACAISKSTHKAQKEVNDHYSVAVAQLIHELFPNINPQNLPPWMINLCPLLARFVKETPSKCVKTVMGRLKRHLHMAANGKLSVSLVAAAILRLHPYVKERNYSSDNVTMPKMLPSRIRDRLACGLFVPMVHVLYGETLVQNCGSHVNISGQEVGGEPYPISLTASPPREFVKLIKRIDVLRGVTSHAVALGFRFPRLAANMHGLSHHLWDFMFTQKMPAAVGMELYDAFFQEFERQLQMTTVMPLDSFPLWLVESVSDKYKRNCAEAIKGPQTTA